MDSESKSICLVGLGNVGSHLVSLLPGLPVTSITLIDPDTFSQDNSRNQYMRDRDVGVAKVSVCAALLAAIRPGLGVETHQIKVEQYPVARFSRFDLMLACVDNLTARQHVNEMAWRFDTPWIDTGVGDDRFARIRTFVPGLDHACAECGWGEAEYRLLDATYPCSDSMRRSTQSTTATSEVGTITAALQCAEAKKILRNELPPLSRQLFFDLDGPVMSSHQYTRNPSCRFDHRKFCLPISCTTVQESLRGLGAVNSASLYGGLGFVRQLSCQYCHAKNTLPGLSIYRGGEALQCGCDSHSVPGLFDLVPALEIETLSDAEMSAPLSAYGFRDGDMILIDEKVYEIGVKND
jgi:molybdopterin-synthase adenylyltransferase